jgi:hypothetical protein
MPYRPEILICLLPLAFTVAGVPALAGAQDEAPLALSPAQATAVATGRWRIIGWNDLGMQSVNGTDFSVASLQPLRNVIHAQVVDTSGPHLMAQPGAVTVTYQAVADASGSINTMSQGKTNFWQYVQAMFGSSLPFDSGLKGFSMPGPTNTPQPMTFDPAHKWFTADAVPITPFDDAGRTNYYPMMRLVAKDTTGAVVATTDIVLPVSDEMNCKTCHASNSNPHAQPTKGWVANSDPARDVKLNILRIHDQLHAPGAFASILAAAKYSANGLEATANSGTPVLCERCHLSNSLAGLGVPGNPAVPRLTRAIHFAHLKAPDPSGNGLTLADSTNRAVCYLCHPGPTAKFLRGPMGSAVAADGTRRMECQSCHGTGTAVAAPTRQGWLDEPVCQSCHTGTAISNSGSIRYASVFDQPGHVRTVANTTFATKPNTPSAGLSLYRASAGHASLECEACHGSTHAEYPSAQPNDNVQSINLEGHAGTISECTTCHAVVPTTVNGGPHGLHPLGQVWIDRHGAAAVSNRTQCQACHGGDYSGTVLSRSQADRTLITKFGTKTFWKGFRIGCYACHNGPNAAVPNPNHAPVVSNATVVTPTGQSLPITIKASDADNNPLIFRIVSQPAHGTTGLIGAVATYFPEAGYRGADTFTVGAWDGQTFSNLGTVSVTVQ